MTKSKRNDEVLNLDRLSFEELGRVPDCGNKSDSAAEPVGEVENSRRRRRSRCDSAHREMLHNHFPAVE